MNTHCTQSQFDFAPHFNRQVTASFNGGQLTSDGGGMLLREVERHLNLFPRLAACFTDYRDPAKTEHPVEHLLKQRIYGLALGYEDINDHDELRHDSQLAMLCSKPDVSGADRKRSADRGVLLASSSTLNRLELGVTADASRHRYKKITGRESEMDRLLLDLFLESYAEAPEEIWLDFDATGDLAYGQQEGIFYNSHYGGYCYAPLYVFCGDQLLCARLLSPKGENAPKVAHVELARMVAQIRECWPDTRIVVRADAEFCREQLLSWCEQNDVYYLIGLGWKSRLGQCVEKARRKSKCRCRNLGKANRRFRQFRYRTLDSWSRSRDVIAKVECLPHPQGRPGQEKDNVRFVVTNLERSMSAGIQDVYERLYCHRGEMENKLKQQKLDLDAGRTSSSRMRANQLRLYFSAFAYVLLDHLRRLGLRNTSQRRAYVGTIRLRYLKIAARVKVTARRVWLSFSEAYPWKSEFDVIARNLNALPSHAHARPG